MAIFLYFSEWTLFSKNTFLFLKVEVDIVTDSYCVLFRFLLAIWDSNLVKLQRKPLRRISLEHSFFKNMAYPPFSFIFGLFKQSSKFFTTIFCEKCPSSIRRRDWNSQPPECQSPPITTGTGPRPWNILYRN